MPELPEVETIARALREGGRNGDPILGATIREAYLLWPRTLAEPDPAHFLARLPGQQILAINRRGKFLVFKLSLDYMLIHLRMSGDLRVGSKFGPGGAPFPFDQHDRLVIDFGDLEQELRLAFNDPRKFGRVWLVPDSQQIVGNLGPEPLDPHFTAEDLYHRLQAVSRQIKPLLLDQSFLAGLGNIYTDEALYLAQIHPLRISSDLSHEEAGRLWESIRKVLDEGIRRNGASIDWVYRGGDFQNAFQVYQRTGQPCLRCGMMVKKISVGQRGTHFCPVCQPELTLIRS